MARKTALICLASLLVTLWLAPGAQAQAPRIGSVETKLQGPALAHTCFEAGSLLEFSPDGWWGAWTRYFATTPPSPQAVWARITSTNQDHYLLPKAPRPSPTDTPGEAGHMPLGLTTGLSSHWGLSLQAEYSPAYADGGECLERRDSDLDLSWDRTVGVWLEQVSASLSLVYRF